MSKTNCILFLRTKHVLGNILEGEVIFHKTFFKDEILYISSSPKLNLLQSIKAKYI